MIREMTKGKPLPIFISFCIPLLLGNIFQQFYNMADSIIVGRFINIDALAAVGTTGSISFLIIGFVVGVCNGFCVPIAQRFGAGDLGSMRKFLANAIYLSGIITVILTVITMLFTRQILVMMDTPADILDQAYSYIIVVFGGTGAIMAYNLLASLLRALGDSRTPLYFIAVACVVNVGLDLLFILVFDMGVAGAGWATVIAQAIGSILCFVYVKRNFPILMISKEEWQFSWEHCKKLLAIGIPMSLQFSITAIGAIILQTAVNRLGTNIVAAVTAGNRINGLLFQPLETLGITIATYCGQNIGANKLHRVRKGISVAIKMMLIYCALAMVIAWVFGKYIALIFIDSANTGIIENVTFFMKITSACSPALGLLYILRNSLQGMGFSILPMMAGVSELVARAMIAFLLVGAWGYLAVCFSGPIAWLFADFLLIPAYFACMKKYKSVPRNQVSKVNQ